MCGGFAAKINCESLIGMRSEAKLRTVLFLLLTICLPIWSGPAFSQEPDPARSQASHHRYRQERIDDQVKGFAKNLDLNQEQRAAVKKILEQRQQEILRIMRTSSGSE